MSNANILEPVFNSLFNYGKWIYRAWAEKNDFEIEDYFKKVQMKNKEDIYPKKIKDYEGTKGKIYLFTIPVGLSEEDFIKHKKGLEAQIRERIEIRLRNGYIEIEILTKKLKESVPYELSNRIKDSIYIPLGESLEGTVGIDLKENPHTLICGTTGSGKSVCTKSILTSLYNNYSSNEVEVFCCDLKMVELALYRNLGATKRFVYTVPDTTNIIADLLEETKNRYNIFMEYGVTNIFEYNKLRNVKKLKYQVLYIEEIVILLEDKSKKAMKLLKQLIAISRASGCYVFLTTQRPSSDVIDSVVKANINNRIVFRVEDEKNSIIALDSAEAKELKGKGHGILKSGSNKIEFQSYFIEDYQVNKLIKHLIIKNKAIGEQYKAKNSKKDIVISREKLESIRDESCLNDLSFLDNL